MNKYKKILEMMIFVVIAFIPFIRVEAATITGKPEVSTQMKSSENGVYSYDVGLNFSQWLVGGEEEGETPLCLIDGYELYEKVNNEYVVAYQNDVSNPDFESPFLVEVEEGKSRTFVVRVYVEGPNENDKSYSDYSDEVVLDHRALATIVTKIANGNGCFYISGEGLNDYVCGEKNTGRNTYQVPAGTEVTVKAVPADGFSFDGWYVFDVESDKISVVVQSINTEYSFTAYELAGDDVNTIAPAFVKNPYEVIEGADQTYVIDNNTDATFRINADYSLFEDGGVVFVDDEEVASNNYTSEEGSTIIKLKKNYVDTLDEGEHTLTVLFNDDNFATTSFTVTKKSGNEESDTKSSGKTINNPKTGDNIFNLLSMLVFSLVGLGGIVLFEKKNN